jgi:hypothetical protein
MLVSIRNKWTQDLIIYFGFLWSVFQLSSLYDIKPPISKAKMTTITKGAIRAIKYYKHVVQSVEKFIQVNQSKDVVVSARFVVTTFREA